MDSEKVPGIRTPKRAETFRLRIIINCPESIQCFLFSLPLLSIPLKGYPRNCDRLHVFCVWDPGWVVFGPFFVVLCNKNMSYEKTDWYINMSRILTFGIPCVFYCKNTLPKTNSSHLKMMVSNRDLQTSRGQFSGAKMFVSGRVCLFFSKIQDMMRFENVTYPP